MSQSFMKTSKIQISDNGLAQHLFKSKAIGRVGNWRFADDLQIFQFQDCVFPNILMTSNKWVFKLSYYTIGLSEISKGSIRTLFLQVKTNDTLEQYNFIICIIKQFYGKNDAFILIFAFP
jgi:hypothetical protein